VSRPRPRLVVRIYLFTIVAVAAAIGSVVLVVGADGPPPLSARMRLDVHMVGDLVAQAERAGGDLDASLAAAARQLEHDTPIRFTIYAADGRRLHAGHRSPPRPLAAEAARSLTKAVFPDSFSAYSIHPIGGDGRLVAYVFVSVPGFGVPPSALTLVGAVLAALLVASLVFARRLAKPLQVIERTARALGEGQLEARTELTRGDEIGEVGRALDGMAVRVTTLMHSQRELMANVSHELRTPLARIRVALDLANEGDAATAREVIADIDQDLAEIERLLDDVMTSARLDLAGGPAIGVSTDPIDTRELLGRAAQRFRSLHQSHAVIVDAPDALTVPGDAALLRRALDNLLDNARKYSEPTNPIALTARRADGHAVVEVVDQGIGIDAADLGEVFRPFFRSDRSRARATGGVGLGLSLAKKIVDAHGGRIGIRSRPGVGTTVTIELPLK
jgi:signal transduction histidine kinase